MKKVLRILAAFLMVVMMLGLTGCMKKLDTPIVIDDKTEEQKLNEAIQAMGWRTDGVTDESGVFIMYDMDNKILGFYSTTGDSDVANGPLMYYQMQIYDVRNGFYGPGVYHAAFLGNMLTISSVREDGMPDVLGSIKLPDAIYADLRENFEDKTCKLIAYSAEAEAREAE